MKKNLRQKMMEKKHFETNAIRTQTPMTGEQEHSTPLFMTSSFRFESAEQMRAAFGDEIEANIYSRFTNPNAQELIDKMCLLEGTEDGFATASGMAAVFSSFAALLESGDHVLACRSVFGSTHTILTKILPKWGISHTYVDINRPEEWEKHIQPNTKMLFLETPSNPGLDIVDLSLAGALAKEHELIFNVDNCFATPYLQQPAQYGADLVTHSATKYIDGQGRVVGGIVLGKSELIKEIYSFGKNTGPSISPFNAWVLSKSLETLAVRMDRHTQNAEKLAQHFSEHSELERVKYPFLNSHPKEAVARKQMKKGGGIVTLEVKGGVARGRKFLDSLQMLSLTANLGDVRTIATHPASTTHSKLSEEERQEVGITPGLIRISVGLENIQDIIEDIEQALQKSK